MQLLDTQGNRAYDIIKAWGGVCIYYTATAKQNSIKLCTYEIDESEMHIIIL